jgi:glycosyltransferase involved in cell wall biosynthesis
VNPIVIPGAFGILATKFSAMKVLFDHNLPFSLVHGGVQPAIEHPKKALEKLGVEVEFLRWWDDKQTGDLIQYFGQATNAYLRFAREKGLPVVLNTFFSETCNRSDARLAVQGFLTRLILALPFGEGVKQQLFWRTYRSCTHNLVGLEAERKVLQTVYHVPPDKITVIPYGLSDVYMQAGPGSRSEPHLICTGRIIPLKNFVPLAQMAHQAQVPILFTGKPYRYDDPYWLQFKALIDGRWVKHHLVSYDSPEGAEWEMVKLLQAARGLVFMSGFENWCMTASEAIACGLPLLLQDQKWSRERFGNQVRYFKTIGATAENARILKQFYEDAPNLKPPVVKLYSWTDTAREWKALYERILSTSR